MTDRIKEEIELLSKYFPGTKVDTNARWVLIPNYKIPIGLNWNKAVINISLEIREGYPGVHPYGFYVPSDLRFGGKEPLNWQSTASNKPSFEGNWGMLSWSPIEPWLPHSDLLKGSNLLNFVLSFTERFKDGQ